MLIGITASLAAGAEPQFCNQQLLQSLQLGSLSPTGSGLQAARLPTESFSLSRCLDALCGARQKSHLPEPVALLGPSKNNGSA